MAKAAFETRSVEPAAREPEAVLERGLAPALAPDGAAFLARALERALVSLDSDASLSAAQVRAAKTALSVALSGEIRDALVASVSSPKALVPKTVGGPWLARPFSARAPTGKPGYFREPSAAIGVVGGEAAASDVAGGGAGEMRLTGGTATWLRVMPAHDPGRTWTSAALRTAMLASGAEVRPIFADARGIGEVQAQDGFGVFSAAPGAAAAGAAVSSGLAFGFHSGELWAVDTYVQDALSEQRPNRAILTLQPQLTAAFESYVGLLQRLGAPGPYRWVIGMDGLMGRSMALSEDDMAGLVRGDCLLNTVEVEGVWDGEGPLEAAIAPFFENLCRACSTPVG